jgi:hypothetical protein
MDREGHPHDGSAIVWEGRERFFINTKKYTGKRMITYGQTAITGSVCGPGHRGMRSSGSTRASRAEISFC